MQAAATIPEEEMTYMRSQKVKRVHIFTDGSFKDEEEATFKVVWAFVVIYEMSDGTLRWRGFAGGPSMDGKQEDLRDPKPGSAQKSHPHWQRKAKQGDAMVAAIGHRRYGSRADAGIG